MMGIIKNKMLYIPKRAESEDGMFIGDGMVPINKDDPDYEKWLRDVEKEKLGEA